MSAHDFVARAYEKACADAMRAAELMPPIVIPPLTTKQKIEREINWRKHQLGALLYKISNKLGYYDDSY